MPQDDPCIADAVEQCPPHDQPNITDVKALAGKVDTLAQLVSSQQGAITALTNHAAMIDALCHHQHGRDGQVLFPLRKRDLHAGTNPAI